MNKWVFSSILISLTFSNKKKKIEKKRKKAKTIMTSLGSLPFFFFVFFFLCPNDDGDVSLGSESFFCQRGSFHANDFSHIFSTS